MASSTTSECIPISQRVFIWFDNRPNRENSNEFITRWTVRCKILEEIACHQQQQPRAGFIYSQQWITALGKPGVRFVLLMNYAMIAKDIRIGLPTNIWFVHLNQQPVSPSCWFFFYSSLYDWMNNDWMNNDWINNLRIVYPIKGGQSSTQRLKVGCTTVLLSRHWGGISRTYKFISRENHVKRPTTQNSGYRRI